LSLSRIVPFSFYPFFMLIFDTMSLSAPDFLALISGAVFEDMEGRLSEKGEAGRIRCLKRVKQDGLDKPHFLFQQDDRYFLEVLYLKLSFLQEIIGRVFSWPDSDKHPNLGLSLDRFWVKLTDHGGLLPFFWNFKVGLMEIGGNAVSSAFLQKFSPSYSLYFLGLVWFYTLLVNGTQGVLEVYKVLGRLNEKNREEDNSSVAGSLENRVEDVLLPRNIFWDPEGKVIREDWRPLWNKAFALGQSLLNTDLYQDSRLSKDEFGKKLQHLRQEIKESMFQPRPSIVNVTHTTEDKAIHGILVKIKESWKREMSSEEDDMEQTVALLKEQRGDFTEKVFPPAPDNEDLDETVILSTQGKPDHIRHNAEEMDQTVILSPGCFEEERKSTHRAIEDHIPETVIISSAEKPKDVSGSTKQFTKTDTDEDDLLTKTVVLRRDKKRNNG
ncbi:MAG: hypothetical protein SVY10_00185, partial [Thermodesulfobacteriota bacterium]|nr:hypothetical protein [Thermodesulfobacteriota bacterium]